uniref:Transketolase n=1 Tax=Blastobotrys adeninivorans TaxID=409370 RepID=A0A060TDE3_BLAAD
MTNIEQLTIKNIRVLVADLVQQFNGGHPGSAMGMAAIGVALWKHVLKYNPKNANWFNRDRFVLSNGHTCLFQYVFLHLSGYESFTMDQLKKYHAKELSQCAGHPEIEFEGIEVTTGPLGQGIANAVGLAIASKNLGATYNREGHKLIDNTIYCMVGDACIQEGVGLEAISFAGHLGLDNLVAIYDNNQITCDGSVDLTNSEDVNAKFRAQKWEVIDIEDGNWNVQAIVDALEAAKKATKPVLINIRTTIGIDTKVANQAAAHGAAYGAETVSSLKELYGFGPEFATIRDEVYAYMRDGSEGSIAKGQRFEKEWEQKLANYASAYPEEHKQLISRIAGELDPSWKDTLPTELPVADTPSRKASGLTFTPVAAKFNQFLVGTADLSPSVNLLWPDKKDFQNPNITPACGIAGDYTGRYIHYGVREHAMCAIANGISAYNKGTFIPITSTFFMFYLYSAPAVRMSALQHLQTIHVATHDSIGTGEDGPTHQPIALAAFYRSLPNSYYIRPADNEEVLGAWALAIETKNKPTILSLSRQNLKQYKGNTDREKVKRGGYIFKDFSGNGKKLQIISVGPETKFAVDAAEKLTTEGLDVRIISLPCQSIFDSQPLEYKRSVLDRQITTVSVEAYASRGWERYAHAGFHLNEFGASLPGAQAYEHFGFNGQNIADKIKSYLADVERDPLLKYEFQDLNK